MNKTGAVRSTSGATHLNDMKAIVKFLTLVAVFMALAVPMQAQSEAEGWHKISPTEIKNAVDLFSNDWMALAAGKEDDMNAMTIAWGGIGELWGKPVVTVYVNHSRYTHTLMELYDYFTVTAFPEEKRDALKYIGTHSRKTEKDKLKNAGLTTIFTELGNPTFKEGNLIIECRTIYSAPLEVDNMLNDDVIKSYKGNKPLHTMFIGEIVNVWKR